MKETYKKWRDMLQPWLEGFGIFKDSVLPNLIYQVNAVSFELWARRPKGQESEDSFEEW